MDSIAEQDGFAQPVRALSFVERGIQAQQEARTGYPPLTCLHLRDPQPIGADGSRYRLPYWRMRIDAVDGWALVYDPAALDQPVY